MVLVICRGTVIEVNNEVADQIPMVKKRLSNGIAKIDVSADDFHRYLDKLRGMPVEDYLNGGHLPAEEYVKEFLKTNKNIFDEFDIKIQHNITADRIELKIAIDDNTYDCRMFYKITNNCITIYNGKDAESPVKNFSRVHIGESMAIDYNMDIHPLNMILVAVLCKIDETKITGISHVTKDDKKLAQCMNDGSVTLLIDDTPITIGYDGNGFPKIAIKNDIIMETDRGVLNEKLLQVAAAIHAGGCWTDYIRKN